MRFSVAFGLTALFLLIPDAYVVFGVMEGMSWWLRGLFLIPTAAYILTVFIAFRNRRTTQRMFNLVLWATLAVFFPILLFAIVSLLGSCLAMAWAPLSRIFNWIALGVACVWICGVIYGIVVGWKKVTVERLKLCFPDLPKEFTGYRVVHLSDMHIGTYASSPATVAEIVAKVNALKPDLVVFTGDLVNMSPDEITPFLGELGKLRATDGIYSVLGNHDYCLYRKYEAPDSWQKQLGRLMEMEKTAGWKLLLNRHIEIERGPGRIGLIGVENSGDRHFIDRSDLGQALAGLPDGMFKILLSHDPTHWRREVVGATDIDLMLAGHTHAMQLKVGAFSPARFFYKEWGGVYREGTQTLVVNTGTGGNVPFRLGSYPQIIEITLTQD